MWGTNILDFSVHSLGSGSSGNSTLIRTENTSILLDAGIPVLQIQKRLSKFHLTLSDIDAVFLTHEHGDHSRSIYTLSRRFGVPIIANPATLTALSRESAASPHWRPMDTGGSKIIGDLLVESFPISHDAVDPVGYNIHHRNQKVSFVTDTGIVSRDTYRAIEGANLAIIEANHDVERLINGPYPQSLKQRILSDVGHLSNEAAADLILHTIGDNRTPSCVWLAHLSDTNNTPRMARRHVQKRLSEAGCGNVVLDVAMQHYSNLVWRPGTHAVQMSLFSYIPD